jgi:hypothetical protein
MKKTIISLCCAFMFSNSAFAQEAKKQEPERDYIAKALDAYFMELEFEDFEDEGQLERKILNRDASYSFTTSLHSDYEYNISAACDKSCIAVDLRLFDSSNKELAHGEFMEGIAAGDVFSFLYNPKVTGEYKISIKMTGCLGDKCEVEPMIAFREISKEVKNSPPK